MRFHIGFSKRISWKWILLILGGLAAFFGIGNHAVLAASTYQMVPTGSGVYDYDTSATHNISSTYRTTGGVLGANNYYFNYSSCQGSGGVSCSPVFSGYAFFTYSAHDFCPDSDKVKLTFKYFTRTGDSSVYVFPSNNFSMNISQIGYNLNSYDSSNQVWTQVITIADNTSFQIRLGFDNNYNTNYYFASAAVWSHWTYDCEYGLQDSTQDIINNDNSNTQQIIDSQQDINDSINNDNVESGVSHGGNFFTNSNINDHGVSTIVTAPVRLLQGMLNSGSSCNDLIIFSSIFGQEKLVTMPSGCILWSRAPSEVTAIYHVVIFGLLGYYVLVDIWKTITDVLDPERKNDYVMDL